MINIVPFFVVAMPIFHAAHISQICFDISMNFEILQDELDIGVRTGRVFTDFSSEYSKLIANVAERIEEHCQMYQKIDT